MSAASSGGAEWSTRLEPVSPPDDLPRRPDDPRLGEVVEFWRGDPGALLAGRPVLIGFPQDEGVRRNGGRAGAAEAPREIRRWLYRLVPWDCETGADLARLPPLDLGDIRIAGDLEQTQAALGEVVGAVLGAGAVPVVLGGGHETAYGHYLGYVGAGLPVHVVNIDAHLDVRPLIDGKGHSGSPFRQMMEHPTHPLAGDRYTCLGVQPQNTSREHWVFLRQRGSRVDTAAQAWGFLDDLLRSVHDRGAGQDSCLYLTVDADAFHASEVPGVSAPNVAGLRSEAAFELARKAGALPRLRSVDLVEINPLYDRDGQSVRWAALLVWNFLVGLATRCPISRPPV